MTHVSQLFLSFPPFKQGECEHEPLYVSVQSIAQYAFASLTQMLSHATVQQ